MDEGRGMLLVQEAMGDGGLEGGVDNRWWWLFRTDVSHLPMQLDRTAESDDLMVGASVISPPPLRPA